MPDFLKASELGRIAQEGREAELDAGRAFRVLLREAVEGDRDAMAVLDAVRYFLNARIPAHRLKVQVERYLDAHKRYSALSGEGF